MTPTPRTDEAARRLIREALDDTLVVEAAAGTGKTTELVNRIVRVLAEGRADVREIVAVTFTEKAAGELKLRLRQRLETERREATIARRGRAAGRGGAEPRGGARQHDPRLLRRSAARASGRSASRSAVPRAHRRPGRAAVRRGVRRLVPGELEDPPEGVRRSLRRTSRGVRPGDVDEDGPIERLRRAGIRSGRVARFQRRVDARAVRSRRDDRARSSLVHALADVSKSASYAGDNLFVDTEPVRRLSADLAGASDARDRRQIWTVSRRS